MAYSTDSTKPTIVRQNPKKAINDLRIEASRNPVFRDVCHLWSLRERARNQVTIGTLRLSMAREGFQYSKDQLGEVLKAMAVIGFGRLEFDSQKQVVALKDITITLQSIAQTALNISETLVKVTPHNSYDVLEAPKVVVAPAPVKAPTPIRPAMPTFAAMLVVDVNGSPVEFQLPKRLTTAELGRLLATLAGETPTK